jgi:hypothetical protein
LKFWAGGREGGSGRIDARSLIIRVTMSQPPQPMEIDKPSDKKPEDKRLEDKKVADGPKKPPARKKRLDQLELDKKVKKGEAEFAPIVEKAIPEALELAKVIIPFHVCFLLNVTTLIKRFHKSVVGVACLSCDGKQSSLEYLAVYCP